MLSFDYADLVCDILLGVCDDAFCLVFWILIYFDCLIFKLVDMCSVWLFVLEFVCYLVIFFGLFSVYLLWFCCVLFV